MGSVSLIFILFADFILSFFTNEPDVKAYAVMAMRIISAGYVFYGMGMVFSNAFNGAGIHAPLPGSISLDSGFSRSPSPG